MLEVLVRATRSLAFRLTLTVAILAYLSTRLDVAEVWRALTSARLPHLLLVLVLVFIDRAVMVQRWVLLLRAGGVAVTAGHAARLFLISSFVGSFLPAGVGGDAVRAYALTRGRANASSAVASVVVDRVLGVLALALVAAIGLVWWSSSGPNDWRVMVIVGATVAASIGALWADVWLRWLTPAGLAGGPLGALVRLSDAMGAYRNHRPTLAAVMLWSFAVQVLRIGQAYVLGLSLGLAVPFGYYMAVLPVGFLMLMLPVSVSGFGLPQGAIVWLLRPVGVPDPLSFALSTLIVLSGLAGNLPGLWLWLQRPKDENPVESNT